jgi:hypothetical protein
MTVMLATLCLNEMEHLPKLYEQHKDWPGLAKWVFVEAVDQVYKDINPTLVSESGLSVDGTTEFLADLAKRDSRIEYVRFGLTSNADREQGKVAARNAYLEVADTVAPKFLVVVDADEFYTRLDQDEINNTVDLLRRHEAWMFRQRHIWRPPSIATAPLFALEVIGGYWQIPHCRVWRWHKGMRYINNHNLPEIGDGRTLGSILGRFDLRGESMPQCIHLGFASSLRERAAKHRYYEARGEGGLSGSRKMYCRSRRAFELWKPGMTMPWRAQVIKYEGRIPEVFQKQHEEDFRPCGLL